MRTTVNQRSNVLVVYYSRTGTTRRVATESAALGQWDLEPVIDMKPRNNLFGYTRSMFDSLFGRSTELAAPRHNPAEYELVIVGTPVWNGAVSAPIRTWLQDWAGRLPTLAFFATEKRRGAERAFRQMAALAGSTPIITLELTARDAESGPLGPRLVPLIATVRAAVGATQAAVRSPEPLPPAPH